MGMMTGFRRRMGAWLGGFEGAAGHRRLRGFTPARSHVNVLLAQAGREMGARARWLVRNNGYASNAVESWAANSVGDGIKPQSLMKNIKTKEKLQRLWLDWTDDADAEGLTDFYGIQRRISREMFITGECFVRLRYRRPEDGLAVPLQLQVLPSEMLPMSKTELTTRGVGEIRQGIEFDAIGRRVAYHFYRVHPGDNTGLYVAGETVRVPADEVIHLIDASEPGQIRGVSRFSAAIVKMFLLDQYDDAELDRKKVAALYALFITSSLGDDMTGPPAVDDGRPPLEEDMLQLSPGGILRLEDGEDVKVTDPAESGSTYEPFQYRTLLQICAALGIPYAFVTGDINKANFSNARLMLMEFRRRVTAFQHSVLVFQFCRPVWQRFMDLAVLSNSLSLPSYERRRREHQAVQWLPPKWDWVDPQKDINAEVMQIEAGLKSRSQSISERGYDAEAMDEQIAEDRKREKRLGLSFQRAGAPAQPEADSETDDESARDNRGQEGEAS